MTTAGATAHGGPRQAGFLADVATVAVRALRAIPRDPESIVPALIIPPFFFFVMIGSLETLTTSAAPGFDYVAFQVPTAIVFAVTGLSRANTVVTDIQTGYFDRLLATPVRRLALLLGLMVADLVLMVVLTIPVVALGAIAGADYATGLDGLLVVVLLSGFWGLAFAGFPYAIALRTGNPAAVNTSFVVFLPLLFLTTAFVPREALSGWLDAVAAFNPVTYFFEGLRAILMEGWDAAAVAKAVAAVAGVLVVGQALALWALRWRIRRG